MLEQILSSTPGAAVLVQGGGVLGENFVYNYIALSAIFTVFRFHFRVRESSFYILSLYEGNEEEKQ